MTIERMIIAGTCHLAFEEVANPPHRLDVSGIVGVVFDFRAQPPDMDIHSPWFNKDITTPYSVKEVLSIVNFVWPLTEIKQNLNSVALSLSCFFPTVTIYFSLSIAYVTNFQKLSGLFTPFSRRRLSGVVGSP